MIKYKNNSRQAVFFETMGNRIKNNKVFYRPNDKWLLRLTVSRIGGMIKYKNNS